MQTIRVLRGWAEDRYQAGVRFGTVGARKGGISRHWPAPVRLAGTQKGRKGQSTAGAGAPEGPFDKLDFAAEPFGAPIRGT